MITVTCDVCHKPLGQLPLALMFIGEQGMLVVCRNHDFSIGVDADGDAVVVCSKWCKLKYEADYTPAKDQN